MSTDDANNAADVASETAERPLSEFGQQVREFQLAFAGALHEIADKANLCAVFDRVMNDAGLPARESHIGLYRGNDILTEITTEEDARRWAVNAARKLTTATETYGYRSVELYDEETGYYTVRLADVLEYFGMPAKQRIDVVISGTFDVTTTVDAWDDANLIDSVSNDRVANLLADRTQEGHSSVQWKVHLPTE